MHYALMNIIRTKKPSIQQLEMLCHKDYDGFSFFCDAESVSSVRSNNACLCDLQTAFMLPFRAR